MRPVNLIPPEQRRGDSAPSRVGIASYIVVAVLAAVLFAVTALVLTSNSVNDKKSELASAQATEQSTQARADALQNFASFQQMKDARSQTISSLAQSRFDWERILNEVSRVLPDGVWLTSMSGTVSPDVSVDGGTESTMRGEVPGPALSLAGCARSQEDVAALISALGDIDGVTRVLVTKSEKPPREAAGGSAAATGSNSGASAGSADTGCGNGPTFDAVAAFDAVSVPATSTAPSTTATATPASAATTTTDATTTGSAASAGGTTTSAEQQQVSSPEEQQQASNIASGTQHARKAAGLIGAGGN